MKTSDDKLVIGRRNALKMLGLGSAAMLATGFRDVLAAEPKTLKVTPRAPGVSGRSTVAFTSGTDRKQMLLEVLEPFKNEIKAGLKKKKQLVIKPNMVVTNNLLCATHPEALRTLLEFLKPIYKGEVIIAESSSSVNSSDGFKNYGYLDLAKDFNVKFVDINQSATGTPAFIIDRNLHQEKIQLSDLLTSKDNFVISISRLKTHNSVVMTASVKNLGMGAPLNPGAVNGAKPISYKRSMHSGGERFLHYNLFLVAPYVLPDFAVIDGMEGMEGNGPINGTPVDHKIALAGFDPIAVDSMCARLMDIPLENIGYLNYCEAAGLGNVDRAKIDIIGGKDPDKSVITYKMGSNIKRQLEWKDPMVIQGQQAPRQAPPAGTPAPTQR
jgi:uncharacterized protein (DUF362 family)